MFPVGHGTALLVIATQERYHTTTAAPQITPEINGTAMLLRRLGLGPVIFIQQANTHEPSEDDACGRHLLGALRRVSSTRLTRPTSTLVEEQNLLVSELHTHSGDFFIDKLGDDIFSGNSLADQLKLSKVTSVIIAGVVTEACCEATVRAAVAHNFQVTVLTDGTACPSPYAHEAMLAKLKGSGLAELRTGMDLRNSFRSMGGEGELGTTLQTLQRALSEVISYKWSSADSECEGADGATMSWASPLAQQCASSARHRRSAEELRTLSQGSYHDLGCVSLPVVQSERRSSWIARRWKGTPMLET